MNPLFSVLLCMVDDGPPVSKQDKHVIQ